MISNDTIILLAEDDPNDVFFMQRALAKAGLSTPLHFVRNGQEALEYLGGLGKFSDRMEFPLPSLLLLDLKMPFVDGFEVLTWARSQPELKQLPIVVLTSSAEDRDRQRAAEAGANGYFVKPPTCEMVSEILALLGRGKEDTAVSA
ncbi:MAG TPA: response regulator [Verrucomicrobiae bacterium]|nr:response regulator [Verrucomicrobiae bacterium]